MKETRQMIEILYQAVCSKVNASISYIKSNMDELALAELKSITQFFDVARLNALDMTDMIQDLEKKIESI